MSETSRQTAEPRDAELKIPALNQGSRLQKALIGLAALAVAGGLTAYYTREGPAQELFRTVPVSKRDVVQMVSATGRLDVLSRTEVPAPSPGRLLSIAVHEGDKVTQGQLLAELDARAAQLAVRSAEVAQEAAGGGVAQAHARSEAADHALSRARALVDKGLASPEDVKRAEGELAQARAAESAARSEQKLAGQSVATARLGQSLTRIEAPRAGVVLHAPERVGAAVSPEQPALFVIGDDLATMRVDAQVSEIDVGQVKPGQTANIVVSAYPGRTYEGKVLRLGVEAERRDGAVLYPLRIDVANPDGTLLPGMTARVELEVARAMGARTVHEAALRFTPEGADSAPARSRIFVRTGPGDVEAVPVRTLVSDGVYVQVEPRDGASLPDSALVAVGLTGGKGQAPSVSLGGKK